MAEEDELSLNWERDDRFPMDGPGADAAIVERNRSALADGYEARLTKVQTPPGGGDRFHYRWSIVDPEGSERAGGSSESVSEAEERVIQEAQTLFGGYLGPSGSGPKPAGT